MKAHIEVRDLLRRFCSVWIFDEPWDHGPIRYYAPSEHGFVVKECAPETTPDESVSWQLPVAALSAIVDAAMREGLGVGQLDTVVLETLKTERERVDKLIDFYIRERSA